MTVTSKQFNSFVWENILDAEYFLKGRTLNLESLEDLILQSFEEYTDRPYTLSEWKDLLNLAKQIEEKYIAHYYQTHFAYIGK